MRYRAKGFTLIELVIALSFAAVVLYGITSIFTSMTKFEFEAVRKSSVDIWSQATLAQMSKEIEDASILYFPSATTPSPTPQGIMGCSNWSTMLNGPNSGGPLDPSSPVVWFYYCYDTSSGPIVPPSTTPITYLRRIAADGAANCPARGGVAPGTYPCSSATILPGSGVKTNDVIATNVNLLPGYAMFTFNINGPATGVNLNFLIGNPTPGTPTGGESGSPSAAYITNPQTITVQTSIALNRPYMNSND